MTGGVTSAAPGSYPSRVRPSTPVLIALCKEKLARFKVPWHVLFLSPAELPTTPTGKVQKSRLAHRAAERIRG
jgi:fatty-acyl-CoA synthase